MKQILRTTPLVALVLAGITLNAQAALPPDNVGDVTLYGHITANSPMWQWTVNDYPGPRLNAKPSTATTADGKTTYPLAGQWFIAASGYLPSFVPAKIGTVSSGNGVADMTTLASPDGPVVLSTTGSVATVTVPATSTDAHGVAVTGTLVLDADEVRGGVAKFIGEGGAETYAVAKVQAGARAISTDRNDSCWVGTPAGSQAHWTRTMSSTTLPVFIYAGPNSASGATMAFNANLIIADATGTVRYASVLPTATVEAIVSNPTYPCAAGSALFTHPGAHPTIKQASVYTAVYSAAAHVLALKPVSVSFPTAASGAWNAALTVTAYQM